MLDVYKIRFFSVFLLFAVIAAYIQYIYTRTEEALPGPSILYQTATYKGKPAVTYAEVAKILRNDPKLARKLKSEDKVAFDLASLHSYDDADDTGHGADEDHGENEYDENGERILYGVKSAGQDGVVAKKIDPADQTPFESPHKAANASHLNEPFLDKQNAAMILAELLKKSNAPSSQTVILPLPAPKKEREPTPPPAEEEKKITLAKASEPKTPPVKREAINIPQPKPTEEPVGFDPQEVILSVQDFDVRKPVIPPSFRENNDQDEDATLASGVKNTEKKFENFFSRLSENAASYFLSSKSDKNSDQELSEHLKEADKEEDIFILPLADAITDAEIAIPKVDNRREMARKVAEIYDKKRKQTLKARKLLKEKTELLAKVKSKLKNLGLQIEARYASLSGDIYTQTERSILGLPDDSGLWRYPELTKTATELEIIKQTVAFLPISHPVTTKGTRMSSNYGYRRDPFTGRLRRHTGIDYAAPKGTRVGAGAPGIVTYAGWRGGYGNVVEVFHGKGLITRYAHLSKIIASRNTKVHTGMTIGLVGSTGRSTGAHLHYEVRLNGQPLNPDNFLKAGAAINALLK